MVIAALWDGSGCLVGEFGEPVSTGFHKEISNSRITTVKMEEQEPRLEMGSDSNFGYEKLVRQVEKFNHEGKERGWEMGYFYQKSVKQSASASWRRRRRRAARVSAATPFCGDRNRNQRPTSTLEQAQTLRLLARSPWPIRSRQLTRRRKKNLAFACSGTVEASFAACGAVAKLVLVAGSCIHHQEI